MIGPKTTSKDGSTAVGGSNDGTIVNVNAGTGASVNVHVEAEVARRLPSHLGQLIVLFAKEGSRHVSGGSGRRDLPPEIIEKITFNNLTAKNRIFQDWVRNSLVLERAYLGVEQQNQDARYLVRRKAAIVYEEEVFKAMQLAGIATEHVSQFVRNNSGMLVAAVIERLLTSYRCSASGIVEEEAAHLAVSLVVADAIVECEVLERPDDAIAS